MRKIDLNNISNEERDELKRLSKGNLQPFSQVVDEFRSRRNGDQSRNNSSAGTPTAIQANGVDIGTGGDSRTDGGRDIAESVGDERTGEVTPQETESGVVVQCGVDIIGKRKKHISFSLSKFFAIFVKSRLGLADFNNK